MTAQEPIREKRLAEIRELVDNINARGRYSGAISPSEVIYASDVSDLLAEVERLRIREAEFEKQRADYHHVASELSRCEHDHDALLHENDALRGKLAGADQRAATYSNELTMALDAGKRSREERDGLLAENAAMRAIVQAVAEAGVGDEYGGGSWLMFAGYDAETVRTKARALLGQPPEKGV